MAETKIIYHLDEQETPYLIKLPIPAENVTLADFKMSLINPTTNFSSNPWTMISGKARYAC